MNTLKKLNFVWTHREGESPEDFVAKQPVSEVKHLGNALSISYR